MQHCQPVKKLGHNRTLIKINHTNEYIEMKTVNVGSSDASALVSVLNEQKELSHGHVLTVIDYCQTSD